MKPSVGARIAAVLLLIGLAPCAAAQAEKAQQEPVVREYPSGGSQLKAFVFTPLKPVDGKRSAMVLLHGGGWSMGEPQWAFARARHFADRGMVAVAAQYRLSDQKTITPL